jgi:hypothetical protein
MRKEYVGRRKSKKASVSRYAPGNRRCKPARDPRMRLRHADTFGSLVLKPRTDFQGSKRHDDQAVHSKTPRFHAAGGVIREPFSVRTIPKTKFSRGQTDPGHPVPVTSRVHADVTGAPPVEFTGDIYFFRSGAVERKYRTITFNGHHCFTLSQALSALPGSSTARINEIRRSMVLLGYSC